MRNPAGESQQARHRRLQRLNRSSHLARQGISPLERLWNGFDSDTELFKGFQVPNLTHKLPIYRFSQAKSKAVVNICSLFKQNIKSCNGKGDVTRDDLQGRFLAQHCSVATLL